MADLFKSILKGSVVIVGVGNILRGDDGFGSLLIERISGKVKAVCIDAGSAPENYAGKIAKLNPDTILIVDAVHLGLEPGGCELLRKDDILKCGFTTHDMSPNMFIEFLEKETNAQIYLLGVQPANIAFGEDLSVSVRNTLDEAAKLLISKLRDIKDA